MPVSRSYSAILPVGTALTISNPTTDPGEPDVAWSYIPLSLGGSITHSGSMPQYRLKITLGENATTFMTAHKTSVKVKDGHYAVSYQPPGLLLWYWTIFRGDLCGSFVVGDAGLPTTKADNQAKMRFVQRCLSELQSFEGQVFLGELADTLRMIKRPAQGLRRAFDNYHDDLRRRRKGSKRARLQAVAQTYLEHSFGWKPLIADINSGFSTLQRFSRAPVRFKPVRATGTDTVQLDNQILPVSYGGVAHYVEQNISYETSVRYYGAVELATQGLPVVTQNLGLRLDRFVPTLYELLPYSFIVDYFSNVGDIISSWSWGQFGLRWSARGELRRTVCKRVAQQPFLLGLGPGTYNWTGREPGQSIMENRSVTRGTYSGSFIPSFRLEVPGMSSTKWLNLAALLASGSSLRPY